jgi:bacterioferritin-associated ferredoxin
MLVCHCKRVRDREIRAAIENGARTRRDVAKACGAGTGCGGCRPVIDELLESETCEARRSLPLLTVAALVGVR